MNPMLIWIIIFEIESSILLNDRRTKAKESEQGKYMANMPVSSVPDWDASQLIWKIMKLNQYIERVIYSNSINIFSRDLSKQ